MFDQEESDVHMEAIASGDHSTDSNPVQMDPIVTESVEDLQITVDDDDQVDEVLNVSSTGEHAPALKAYFLGRLEEKVISGGGAAHSLTGWRVEVFKRNGGVAAGIVDVFYYSNLNKKYRSRIEAIIGLGISQSIRTLRAMSKLQLHEISLETREKHLVGQVLYHNPMRGTCTHLSYEDGHVIATFAHEQTSIPAHIRPCFAIGNITVLSWGRISPDSSFHTSTQIYPIGFKCLRQEHDAYYDRVVDCLCEIEAVDESGVQVPFFRISISWVGEHNQAFVRVYEAKSPQLAWQAAMLETLGIEYTETHVPHDMSAVSSRDLVMDREEAGLREQIREVRRDYFRALRAEQSLGITGAVKPRLSIDSVDGFGDEIILRMIEGLPGADNCDNYQFLDTRVRDGGRKHIVRCLARVNNVTKQLEKVMKKTMVKETQKEHHEEKKKRERERDKTDTGERDLEKEQERERIKRARAENKEIKAQKLNTLAQHRQRLRDLDKNVKALKETLLKEMRRRKSEARSRIEGICEAEGSRNAAMSTDASPEESYAELPARGSRPQPTYHHLPFNGDSFGELLELWGFLVTFAEPLGLQMVPSVEALMKGFRFVDQFVHKMCQKTVPFVHALDTVVQRYFGTDPFEGAYLEVKRARTLLDNIAMALVKPLMPEFFKLLGVDVELQQEASKFMLNRLSWMEIARVVLLGSATKEVGLPEAEVIGAIKGRPYTLIPDAADRRMLRLSKKRIATQFKYRADNQDALCGFTAGFCVRVPYAFSDCESVEFCWREMYDLLRATPSSCVWKIYEILHVALIACGAVELPDKERIKSVLKASLQSTALSGGDAIESKEVALAEFQYLSEKLDLPSERETSFSNDVEVTSLTHVRRRLASSSVLSFASPLYNSAEASKLLQKLENFDPREDLEEDEGTEEKKKSVVDEINDHLIALLAAVEISEAEEMSLYEQLPIATQRCFIILRDLMLHPQCNVFLHPVDVVSSSDYYKKVKHPLSFSDIRRHLIRGGYGTHFPLTKFFLDINLVFENALTFNSEISPIGQAALKMTLVFERMFQEMVLAWEYPIGRTDMCTYCRSDDANATSRISLCDRCEATYHLNCLESIDDCFFDKRVEWFCPACVDQSNVAATHHFRTAVVTHPATKVEGTVVGIDQVNMRLRLTVLFKDSTREIWTCGKVKANFVSRIGSVEVPGEDPKPPEPLLAFPDGYTEEDIDLVSGLARGYQAWGSMHHCLPPCIDADHSLVAATSQTKHQQFLRWQRAISILGPLTDTEELPASDWLCLLLALARKNLSSSSSSLAAAVAALDHDATVPLVSKRRAEIGDDIKFIPSAAPTSAAETFPVDSGPAESLINSDAETATISQSGGDESDDLFSTEDEAEAAEVAESDDDSSLELFDDDFDPLKPKVEDIASWEMRRASRQKGREDALVAKVVLAEMIATVDLTEDDAFEDMLDLEHRGGLGIASQTAMKACLPRPSDALDSDEWLKGWEAKFLRAPTGLCQFCGLSEAQLGSPLVCGQTWQEWMACDYKGKSADGTAHAVWVPFDKADAEEERRECARIERLMREGSLVVHECCADLMDTARRATLRKSSGKDDDVLGDMLSGLRRGKRSPVGTDAEGSIYWILPGSSNLFISTAATAPKYGFARDSNILSDLTRDAADLSIPGPDERSLGPGSSLDALPCRWIVYSTAAEVAEVLKWLRDAPANERLLKRLLLELFPEAAALATAPAPDPDAMEAAAVEMEEVPVKVEASEPEVIADAAIIDDDDAPADEEEELPPEEPEEGIYDSDLEEAEFDENDEAWARPKRAVTEVVSAEPTDKPKFHVEENALVWCNRGDILREAKIYGIKKVSGEYFYNVKFVGNPRPEVLNNWHPEETLHRKTNVNMELQRVNYERYIKAHALLAPSVLQGMIALRFARLSDRAGAGLGLCRGNITYSDSDSVLATLKLALLTIEAALPIGSVDDSDDKWGGDFDEPWRCAVAAAATPSALMECQLSLEYAIKTGWLRPAGNKLLCSLPSRAYAAKYATYSMVALRMFTLDQSIKYEKVVIPSGDRPGSSKQSSNNAKSNKGKKSGK